MSFLVRNERADLLISTDSQQNTTNPGAVTEEQVNSEVELLSSTDLLRQVVKETGLGREFAGGPDNPTAIEKATRKLVKNLTIIPVRKSALINLTYSSPDRDGAVRVLNQLQADYLAKHTTLHTSGSAAVFFRQKSEAIAAQLQAKEASRLALLQHTHFNLLPEQRQAVLRQIEDAKKTRDEVQETLRETENRLDVVAQQEDRSEKRIVTLDHTTANQYSVERLNTMLAELGIKRTDLITKFRPEDRLVVQVDKEIADTKVALENAQHLKSQDTTTDVNPIRQSLDSEAVRLRQTRAGLLGRREYLDGLIKNLSSEVAETEGSSIDLENTDRDLKELEQNLEVYRSKALAAGIDEDLDAAKISNVVVVSHPVVPVLPAPSPFNLFTGLALALIISLSIGYFWDLRYGGLSNSSDLEAEMGIPVLTSLMRR